MNMTVTGAQAGFVDGKLVLQYFSVVFDAGEFPDRINGSMQITPEDGVTITSTPDEVEAAAIAKAIALIKVAKETTTTTTTTTTAKA